MSEMSKGMKAVCIVRSDDCTYSFNETLFVTPDITLPSVWNRLVEMYGITTDSFIELACDGEVECYSKNNGMIHLIVEDVEVVK